VLKNCRVTLGQSQLFYLFNLEARIPAHHLLRRINPAVTRILAGVREKLGAFYSEIGRPSIDPELMIRILIAGYCYGMPAISPAHSWARRSSTDRATNARRSSCGSHTSRRTIASSGCG
jgi:hypothetical protein